MLPLAERLAKSMVVLLDIASSKRKLERIWIAKRALLKLSELGVWDAQSEAFYTASERG